MAAPQPSAVVGRAKSGRGKNGRLSLLEIDRMVDALAKLVFEQGRCLSHEAMARELGVHRSSIAKMLERMYERAERERPLIAHQRDLMLSRLDVQYRRSVETYDAAVADGERRVAVEAIRAGSDAIAKAAKIAGVEDARPPESADRSGFRFVIEGEWSGAAPAAIAAAARVAELSPAPGPAAIPRSLGANPSAGSGSALGQGYVDDRGDAEDRLTVRGLA